MRLVLFLLALFGLINATPKMGKQFISGFETGIFIRGQPKMMKQYGCKPPSKKDENDVIKQVRNGLPIVKMAAAKNAQMKMMVEVIELFLKDVSGLMTVLNNGYDGGDYCAGLVFGMNGADMLLNISQKAVQATVGK